MLVIPPAVALLRNHTATPDWDTIKLTLWLYGIALVVYLAAHCVRTPWKLDQEREADVVELEGERDVAEQKAAEASRILHDGRPIVVLEVLGHISGENTVWSFTLRNVGSRAARFINLATQTSAQGRYRLHFSEVTSLLQVTASVSYWVEDCALPDLIPVAGDSAMLQEFLNDDKVYDDPGDRVCLRWWDIPITFRDTDESLKEEITRLCFDVDSSTLYATAAPYTERKSMLS